MRAASARYDSGKSDLACRTHVKLLTFMSTGLFGRKPTVERGKVQIWVPQRFERPLSYGKDDNTSRQAREPVWTASSTAPSLTRRFTMLRTTPIQTEDSSSVTCQMPDVPKLVFFVGPDTADGGKLSLLTIESTQFSIPLSNLWLMVLVDVKTMMQEDRCACRIKNLNCIHVTIERLDQLRARLIDNEELNLATLGKFQTPKNPKHVQKLRYLQI